MPKNLHRHYSYSVIAQNHLFSGLCLNGVAPLFYSASHVTLFMNFTARQRCEREEWGDNSSVVSAEDQRIQEEEEEKPSESLPLESSGISNLTDPNKDDTR